MSSFRKVDSGTWADARFAGLSQDAKFLWLYLITGPHVTSLPGLFHLSLTQISESLSWTKKKVEKCFAELAKDVPGHAHPMAKADWKSRVVWLPNAAKHNRAHNLPTLEGWRGHLARIPECALKHEAARHYVAFVRSWGLRYLSTYAEFCGFAVGSDHPSDHVSDLPSNGPSDKPSNQPSDLLRSPSPSPSPAISDPGSAQQSARLADEGFLPVQIGSARCERMCEVYLEVLGEAGWSRSPLRERWERQALCDAINAHLASDGTVEATIAELRRAVAEWVAEHAAKPSLTSGWAPRRFKDWLAEGRPSGKRLTGSGEQPPPRDSKARPGPTSAEETASEPVTPEEQAAFEERIRNPQRPKRTPVSLPVSLSEESTPDDLAEAKRKIQAAKDYVAAKGADYFDRRVS